MDINKERLLDSIFMLGKLALMHLENGRGLQHRTRKKKAVILL